MNTTETKFFGRMGYNEDEVWTFPKGLPGFEEYHRFVWLRFEDTIFSCLQSLDDQSVAFITMSPFEVVRDYVFDLDDEIVRKLQLELDEDALTLVILTIPSEKPEDATANLQAPVVVNWKRGLGMQVILNDGLFPLKFPIWQEKPATIAK